jgi:hypothetical protein
MKTISKETYEAWKDQPILHDEDMWMGKYKTYGEMWDCEGFEVEGLQAYAVTGWDMAGNQLGGIYRAESEKQAEGFFLQDNPDAEVNEVFTI